MFYEYNYFLVYELIKINEYKSSIDLNKRKCVLYVG